MSTHSGKSGLSHSSNEPKDKLSKSKLSGAKIKFDEVGEMLMNPSIVDIDLSEKSKFTYLILIDLKDNSVKILIGLMREAKGIKNLNLNHT